MGIFFYPNNASPVYQAGNQPFNPGEPGAGGRMESRAAMVIPWPYMVPSITMTPGYPGIPRIRAGQLSVGNYAPLLTNDLFIGGFVSKSQG